MQTLLGAPGPNGTPSVLAQLPKAQAANLTGKTFFPHLISGPFKHGLVIAFSASLILCLIAAAASWMRGSRYVHRDDVSIRSDGPLDSPDANPAAVVPELAAVRTAPT